MAIIESVDLLIWAYFPADNVVVTELLVPSLKDGAF